MAVGPEAVECRDAERRREVAVAAAACRGVLQVEADLGGEAARVLVERCDSFVLLALREKPIALSYLFLSFSVF